MSILCVYGVCVCVFQSAYGARGATPASGGHRVFDDIEEVWRDHVVTLLKGKSEAAAVNTMFLLNRLFLVSDPHVVLLSFS